MAIKITGDNLQYDDTAIASLSATNLTLAAGKGLVARNIAASGTLHVTGEAQLDGALHVDGNANMEGTLNVDGASTLAAITATGNAAITGTLNVTGLANINGAVGIDGAVTMESTLDVAGNLDVDGTANLDAVDIDGAVQIDGATTFGVDDTGVDVKMFGATSGAYLQWDESADKLLTAGGATIDIVKDKLLIGGTAMTCTAAELNVLDNVTAGTVGASLGVVVDSNKDVTGFRNVTATGAFIIGSANMSEADLEKLDGITNGTCEAAKALVADASRNIGSINTLTATDLVGTNIDGIIGADTARAGNFAALTASSLRVTDVVTFDGEMNFGNASADILTVTGDSQFTGSAQFAGQFHAQAGFSGSNGLSVTDGAAVSMTLNDTTGFDLMVTSVNIQANTAITGTVNVQGAASFSSTLEVEGATDLEGALNVDGASVLATAKISDLTSGRLVLAGTAGELEDNANLAFDGTTLTLGSTQDVKARTFITYSDATLKTEIKPLDNAIDKVMSMRGVTYKFKGQEDHTEVGFLAQEMKQSVPEVVYGNGDGNLGIDYAKLTSVLVEAVKSQQEQIEELRAALLKK